MNCGRDLAESRRGDEGDEAVLGSVSEQQPVVPRFQGIGRSRLSDELQGNPRVWSLQECDQYRCHCEVDRISRKRVSLAVRVAHLGVGERNAMRCRSPLDKCMRMSDWSQRPLDRGQLFYAAQDAYVTRKVYVIMARWILEEMDSSKISDNIALLQKNYVDDNPSKGGRGWKDYFVYSTQVNKKAKDMIQKSVMTCEDYYPVCWMYLSFHSICPLFHCQSLSIIRKSASEECRARST